MSAPIKHTPGPWWNVGKPNCLNSFTVFHGPNGPSQFNQICQTDSLDDARLIAAAPDLYEACKTFELWLSREEHGLPDGIKRDTPEGEKAWREWYDENLRLCDLAQRQARAAIAKAEGVAL